MHILLEKRCIAISELRRPCLVGLFDIGFATTIMDKSLGTLGFLGRFPIHTEPTPPLTPQTMLDACIQNFFRVSTLYRVGGGRTARKFRKGCTEMTEKNEYCSTVPRTFVQDCSITHQKNSLGFWSFHI